MSPATVFAVANNGILAFWALLIMAPRAKITQALVHSLAAPAILGLTYIWMIATGLPGAPAGAGFSSLAGVMAFFTSPVLATGAWIHYLVFDLFVGAWQARDAQRRGLPHLILVPCLVLTLLFGPSGLLAYLLLRLATGRGGASLAEL